MQTRNINKMIWSRKYIRAGTGRQFELSQRHNNTIKIFLYTFRAFVYKCLFNLDTGKDISVPLICCLILGIDNIPTQSIHICVCAHFTTVETPKYIPRAVLIRRYINVVMIDLQ